MLRVAPRLLILAFLMFCQAGFGEDPAPTFAKEIKPILRDKCSHCHNRETLPEKVSFESRELAFVKTKEGLTVIVPGKPDESFMVVALETPTLHEKAMPLVGPRPNVDEIALIRRWIAAGADWPEGPAGMIVPPFKAKE
jgi:Planctomycete cytochrome C